MYNEPTNEDRADWANEALCAFANETGQVMPVDKEEVLMDLLCNLRHWCDINDVDFDALNETGTGMYFEEIEEGQLG